MNEKKIFEKQENKIESQKGNIDLLEANLKKATDSVEVLSTMVSDLNYFTLQGNENAMSYFESLGFESDDIEKLVAEYIYEENLTSGDNPIIPFDGINGTMKINKIRFLNHRWIIADFTDGRYWGEMVIEYYITKKKQIELTSVVSLLYPST
ncbi:MAG: hypothetical protein IMY67_04390 [Bacteroidetes bacterium]|nr:hypothetical protein [Bacteroidota bacterium]